MSTETFPNPGYNGGGKHLLIFIVLSAVIHTAFVLGLLSFGEFAGRFAGRALPRAKEPVVVDVVDLPPGPSSTSPAPNKPAHFADRNQSVPKETYPEPSRGSSRGSIKRPLPGSHMPSIVVPPALKGQSRPSGGSGTPGLSKSASEGDGAKGNPRALKKESGNAPGSTVPSPAAASPIASDEGGALKRQAVEAAQGNNGVDTKGQGGTKGEARSKAQSPGDKRPSLFPSSDRLAELEKRYEAEAPKGETGKSLQLNTSELRYQKYLMNMKRRIEFHWEYPDLAVRNSWQGKLQINFTINKDGSVSNIAVAKSSNYPALDDAAVTALRLATPFPPFPESFGIEEITIKGSFEYMLYEPGPR